MVFNGFLDCIGDNFSVFYHFGLIITKIMENKDKRNKTRFSKKSRLFRGNQYKSTNVANVSNIQELKFECSSAKKMNLFSSCSSSKSSVDIANSNFLNKNNFSADDD